MAIPDRKVLPRRIASQSTEVFYADPHHFAKNPDFCLLPDGRILCVFLEADQHIPFHYSRIILLQSADGGHTWGDRRIIADGSPVDFWGSAETVEREPWITPRISRLRDGRLVINCDKDDMAHAHESQKPGICAWWSTDDGETWSGPYQTGVPGIEPDQVVQLDDDTLLMGSHFGVARTLKIGQFVSRSMDGGRTWPELVSIASDDVHNFCEGAIVQLASGRLVCVMRENNHNNYPCYFSFSDDRGKSWSKPIEAPFSGDRPYCGILSDGRFFVTYRDMAGRPASCAWVGDIEKDHGYQVSIAGGNRGRLAPVFAGPIGEHYPNVPAREVSRNQHLVELGPDALRLQCAYETPIRYELLPPDYQRTHVVFEAEMRLDGGDDAPRFRLQVARVGIVLTAAPTWLHISPNQAGHPWVVRKAVDLRAWRTLRVQSEAGLVRVFVDGEEIARVANHREQPWDRSYFGSVGAFTGGVSLRKVLYQTLDETREHQWRWNAADGTYLNQYEIDHWIELAENTEGFPDNGYTTWVELANGDVVVAETTNKGVPLQKSQLHAYSFNIRDL